MRIHVGSIHVHLAAVVVNQISNFVDGVFVLASGGRESDHDGSQVILVFLSLDLQIFDVDAAIIHLHWDDCHAGETGARRVGAVS